MKKISLILICAMLASLFTACSDSENGSSQTANASTAEGSAVTQTKTSSSAE